MSAIDYVEACLADNDAPSLFSGLTHSGPLQEQDVVSAFRRLLRSAYQLNIEPWEPDDPAYPRYMLLGSDRGILAYVSFSYHASQTAFDEALLQTDSHPLLQTVAKADSRLDRPVFFVSFIDCPDLRALRFETNEQIKHRWLSTGFSERTYCPVYREMGDAENLLRIWTSLKKNGVH